ncbi:unnamed protein product [Mytilus coruscus]|uniref:SUEL-type lectin domain-containing protein n=1 Tax=Mytilus coruscus TaxID=42192 RepID=A0A6J8EDM1_MYTCO|nr:unnamed protein product [Mytilus coruscus]
MTTPNGIKETSEKLSELNTKLEKATNNEITISSSSSTKRTMTGISYSTEGSNSQTTITKPVKINTTNRVPVFVSVGLTSTEKDIIANGTFTTKSSVSEVFQKTSSIVSEQTTRRNVTDAEEESSPSSYISLIIGALIAIIVTCTFVILCIIYRDKINKNCGKNKVSTRRDEEDNASCHSIFDDNLNIINRLHIHQLPPFKRCPCEQPQQIIQENEPKEEIFNMQKTNPALANIQIHKEQNEGPGIVDDKNVKQKKKKRKQKKFYNKIKHSKLVEFKLKPRTYGKSIFAPDIKQFLADVCCILTIQLKYYTACYGNTGLENLQPSCGIGEKIAVVGVFAFAKELSTSCPTEITILNAAVTPDTCCQYDSNDCYIRYVGSTYRSFYQLCNGNALCNIQVASVTTTCNQFVYLARTNYMTIYYYCISDQGLDPCTSLNTKDSVVFLLNSGYPFPLSGLSSCTCSVEASCASRVRLTAIDLRLGTSTSCGQSITITDGSTVTIFDCSDNNDYLPTTLYISTSHFIQIQIVDNLLLIDGYYFILLEGISSGAELTLSCGSTARDTPSVPSTSLPDCHSTDVTTDSTTTPIATTTEAYVSSVAAITSIKSTYVESMTTSTIAGADTTTDVITVESTNDRTTLYKQVTYTSAEQNFASSGLTSTEKDMIANGTLTTISSVSESLQETSSIVLKQTTEKNVTVTEEQSSPTSSWCK